MSRKRVVVVNDDEDIVSYEHNLPGRFVRVLVGSGTTLPDGTFIPAPEQSYESLMIKDDDYISLMATNGNKPAGTFRREDLWAFVDSNRAKNVKP